MRAKETAGAGMGRWQRRCMLDGHGGVASLRQRRRMPDGRGGADGGDGRRLRLEAEADAEVVEGDAGRGVAAAR